MPSKVTELRAVKVGASNTGILPPFEVIVNVPQLVYARFVHLVPVL